VSSGLDVSGLSPSDCAAAFRSFARRFGALFAGWEEDESADALLNRPGPNGESATQIAARVGRSLAAAGEAVRRILVADRPSVTLGAESAEVPDTPQAALERVTREAARLAERVDRTDADAWLRTGDVDGQPTTAIDLVRDAVKTGSDGYRAAERAVDDARRHPPEGV
jgi:hypothetical protein